MTEFVAWAKTPRYFRDIVITEKIDGTNAAVIIPEDWEHNPLEAQSRKRLITPADDNYGFARWVAENCDTLARDLGPGRHYGEWWGQGIQRKYGMDHKAFSLFNTFKWRGAQFATPNLTVVPVLYEGAHDVSEIDNALDYLRNYGSAAAKSEGARFADPEGICIFHTASRQVFKVTLENDESPKSLAA